MKIKAVIIVLSVWLLGACSSNNTSKENSKEQLIESIQQKEKTVFNDQTNTYDHAVALQLIKDYEKYIELYPKDSISPEYLFMSGKLCKSISMYGEAVRKLQALSVQYPTFKSNPSALFMSAMILESNMQDTIKAKETYELFIKRYPQHELTDDAVFLLNNLGKSDEELMEIIKAKQKK